MLFRMVLGLCRVALRLLFGLASLVDPSFKKRLAEADLSFVVRSNVSSASGLFRLQGGKLLYRPGHEGPADFAVSWNGWGDADTWGKRLRLNMMAFLNTGMVSLEGDLSCMVTLLTLLGEALGSLGRKKPTTVKRIELRKERP